MNPRTLLLILAAAAALPAGRAWADDAANPSAPAEAAKTGTPPADAAKAGSAPGYDALFSEILKALPQEKRALVDSARGAQGNGVPPAGAATAEEARKAAADKRSRAMQSLPPEIKARVDKAISDLDARRKEKQAEFKDLDK
jgi:hypothetical protein